MVSRRLRSNGLAGRRAHGLPSVLKVGVLPRRHALVRHAIALLFKGVFLLGSHLVALIGL